MLLLSNQRRRYTIGRSRGIGQTLKAVGEKPEREVGAALNSRPTPFLIWTIPLFRLAEVATNIAELAFMEDHNISSSHGQRRRGYIKPDTVKWCAFAVITICIVTSVVASILAIWEFARTDVLLRTIATCVVVAAGVAIFAVVNAVFGNKGG